MLSSTRRVASRLGAAAACTSPSTDGHAPARTAAAGASRELQDVWRTVSRERAQAIVWVVLMLPLFLGIAGLSIDAGRIFDARREAQNVADGAARVAAMQINLQKLHTTGQVQLNDQAAAAARRYVTDHSPGPGWDPPGVTADANGVQVKVTRHLPTTFMRIINPQQEVTVSAVARAEPCVGITSGQSPTGGSC